MKFRFTQQVTLAETQIQLVGPDGPHPYDRWAIDAPNSLLTGVDIVQRLVAAETTIAENQIVLVEHKAIASLSAHDAISLGLPRLTEAVARIQTRGLIVNPGFRVDLQWLRPTGQPYVDAQRYGAWLRIGDRHERLPDVLYQIAEATDALNAKATDDIGERYICLARLQELLPGAKNDGQAETKGVIGAMTIIVADAFSLDLAGEGADARLIPILHRSGGDPDAPLLSPEQQTAFGGKQFNGFARARSVYILDGGVHVVLQPVVRKALDEVRRVQGEPLSVKRALLANPRTFLRQALGDEADETFIEGLFRETAAYSDRVIGLGLWVARVVPWIKFAATDWFGSGETGGKGDGKQIEDGGLIIGSERISLSVSEAEQVRVAVEKAIGAGDRHVIMEVGGKPLPFPATIETLNAINQIQEVRQNHAGGPVDPPVKPADPAIKPVAATLIIEPNEEKVGIESQFVARRASPPLGEPLLISTPLKVHQQEGLAWLQKSWVAGRPGVLLADDMGLGKTLQGLAFLAWLKQGMDGGTIKRAPVLIVAPTGLLQNWQAEHEKHLTAPGLGMCLQAYGTALSGLKRKDSQNRPGLDISRIVSADWVLTTYETLRDYSPDFGQVRFAALIFDEVQKIKTPGVRLTDAAKTMNADFKIAMTGTPVENRLADLWCITDAVHAALLGSLKEFSAKYERNAEPEDLKRLKNLLDQQRGGRPPPLLRRMKRDKLPELSEPEEILLNSPMPKQQQAAYQAILSRARTATNPGAVLEALQGLRSISLHPVPEADLPDEEFIAASARLVSTFQALDNIARTHEKALVFLEDLKLQSRMAGLIQRRYSLSSAPCLINGQVDGGRRQILVDQFQASAKGFGVMILSPRAGGVGLTITCANHVIHLSRWWNPAVEDQCTGRVARIGQVRPVFVHIPIAIAQGDAKSFDLNLHALLERKRQLMRDTLSPAEFDVADKTELLRSTIG